MSTFALFSSFMLFQTLGMQTTLLPPTPVPCLHYAPDVVRLYGTLLVYFRFGGKSPGMDVTFKYPFLQLSEAVNVCGDTSGDADRDTIRAVTKIQVEPHGLGLRPFIGKDVMIVGTLYDSSTMNHYTKVLISADSMRTRGSLDREP